MDKPIRLILAICLVVPLAHGMAWADDDDAKRNRGNRFLGIWGGIDPGDGSSQQFLISAGENGEFNLSWYETFWSVCDGRRGVGLGTGRLAPDSALVMGITISCFDPDEDVVDDTVTFQLVGKDMLLATAGAGVFVEHPLFRVSNR